jgi:hypothetical protein
LNNAIFEVFILGDEKMNIIPQGLAIKYMTAFTDLGWVNLQFGEKSKSLLARLKPRIDTEKEIVLLSTYPSNNKPCIGSISVDNCEILDISIIITDRRIVLLNRSDNTIHNYYFNQLDRWERPGYSGITGNLTYKLITKDSRIIEIVIHVKGSGWFAAIAGFWVPMAMSDTQRGVNRVASFVDFFDSFIQTIYNSSHSTVL